MGFDNTEIFAFEIPGQLKRHVDPQSVRRQLMAKSAGRFYQWVKQSADIEQAMEAISSDEENEETIAKMADLSMRQAELESKIVAAAYPAFGLSPVSPETGEGVTEGTLVCIVQAYLEWLTEKKDDAGAG